MTLMRTGENKDLGNALYAAGKFALMRKTAKENADWTRDFLAARQNWMANQAVAISCIAQLS